MAPWSGVGEQKARSAGGVGTSDVGPNFGYDQGLTTAAPEPP
jgi:hypothetical protein